MMSDVKAIHIVLKMGDGKDITLTMSEAQNLHKQLDKLFSEKNPFTTTQPVYPGIQRMEPLNPLIGKPIITCETKEGVFLDSINFSQ